MKRIKLLGFKLATMKYAHKLSTMYESQPLRLAITSKETLEWRKITESLMPVLPAVNVVEQSPSGVINHKKRKILASRKQLSRAYGSEFSQGVCISIFISYVLALYLRNFRDSIA